MHAQATQDVGPVDVLETLSTNALVKGVRLRAKATLFGQECAEQSGEQDSYYVGTIDRWHTPGEILYIKWPGWTQCKQAALDVLKQPEHELSILPYADGRPAPSYRPPSAESSGDAEGVQHRRLRARADAHGQHNDESEGEMPSEGEPPVEVDCHGQVWRRLEPTGVRKDQRTQSRQKPKLNTNGAEVDSFVAMFYLMLPPPWIDTILRYSNPKLLGHDKITAKLTKGELLRWFGYVFTLAVHTGLSVEKMWKTAVDDEDYALPPPALGRHGMTFQRYAACLHATCIDMCTNVRYCSHALCFCTARRFKKIKSVLSFGASDDSSFERDPWGFIRPMLDAFNAHMEDIVEPGWLLCLDEAMSAWRGAVGLNDPAKCPHRSFVQRKPEPLGVELKGVGCALSGMSCARRSSRANIATTCTSSRALRQLSACSIQRRCLSDSSSAGGEPAESSPATLGSRP